MAKARRQKLKKPDSTPSPGRRRLKVFKTPIGFHDAYVAAPSRAAALRAWGAGTDLFSAGIAEEVNPSTSSGLGMAGAKAALAEPGTVVRVGRGGDKDSPSASSGRTGKKSERDKPKPSRATVARAEAALAALAEKQAAEQAALVKDEKRLAKRRRALEAKHGKATAAAEAKRDAAKARYRKAMADWAS